MKDKFISKIVLTASVLLLSHSVFAAEPKSEINLNPVNQPQESQSYVSLNMGQLVTYASIAKILNKGAGVFIPVFLDYVAPSSSSTALSLGLIYRYDSNGTFAGYQEIGALVGPQFRLSGDATSGWRLGIRGGFGYAAGPRYNDPTGEALEVDSSGNLVAANLGYYKCFEGILQAKLGYQADIIPQTMNAQFGAGLTSFIPLSTQNPVNWSTQGILVHRLNPMIDLSVGFYL